MKVKVLNDCCLEIVDDPEHAQKYRGQFVYQPSSVRRDLVLDYTVPNHELTTRIFKTAAVQPPKEKA